MISELANWITNALATDTAFVGLSIATLLATGIVAAGLWLEYERHELRIFRLRKTRPFHNDFPTVGQYRPARKTIGSFCVVIGVVLEATFGLFTFVSAAIRENRTETRLVAIAPRSELLYGENRAQFVKKLKLFPRQEVEVRYPKQYFTKYFLNDEALATAMLLSGCLQSANWKLESIVTPVNGPTGEGAWVIISPDAPKATREAANALRAALLALPIETGPENDERSGEDGPNGPDVIVLLVLAHPL
jgi:hypothetical protein